MHDDGDDEPDENIVVVFSDAVICEGTVVVKLLHTTFAAVTMVAGGSHFALTDLTILLFHPLWMVIFV
jgi:hypothetical protein